MSTPSWKLSGVPGSNQPRFVPPEIWEAVVSLLPRPAQRTCLSVSRTFHYFALRMVFSRITVCFGAWETLEASDSDSEGEVMKDREKMLYSRSFDILYRIMFDQAFAAVVKHMEVEAFQRTPQSAAFEMRCLQTAIDSMRELVSFVWQGNSPLPTEEIVQALAVSCKWLRRFAIPLEAVGLLPIDKLTDVQSVYVTTTWPDDNGSMDHCLTAASLKTVRPEIRVLELPYGSPADVPINLLPNLTHLGLVVMQTLEGLDSLLRQLSRLQSLSVFSPSMEEYRLFIALSSLKLHLPQLTSLALQCYDGSLLSPTHSVLLTEFLRDRTALKRLYCNFEVPMESLVMYLDAVRTLKNLEIFDLRMTHQDFTHNLMHFLIMSLPARLSAIKLTSRGVLADAHVFSALWLHFTDLQFLYVRTWKDTDVTVEDLIRAAKSLELVGYNGRFYDVTRHASGQVDLSPWTARRIAFRDAHDFGCSGWEWLMRHLTIVP